MEARVKEMEQREAIIREKMEEKKRQMAEESEKKAAAQRARVQAAKEKEEVRVSGAPVTVVAPLCPSPSPGLHVASCQAAKAEKLAAFEARQAEVAAKQREKEQILQEELARQEKERQAREAKRVAAMQEAIR